MRRSAYLIILFLLSLYIFVGCEKEDQMRNDIQFTLDTICLVRDNDKPYIYSYDFKSNMSNGLIKDEDINKLFLSQIQYEIDSLSKESDSEHGEAIISFSFPDLMAVIEE